MTMFNRETDFEDALVELLLVEKDWQEVLMYPLRTIRRER